MPYFTPNEVSLHNTIDDIWVSYLGKVYDLTPLIEKHKGDIALKPIIASAGQDISHWFNPKTGDLKKRVDPSTGVLTHQCPHGIILHVPPPCPSSGYQGVERPWWKETRYQIGRLTKKIRLIRLVNTLTLQTTTIEVCTEETMKEILKRYLLHNAHASSYTWKYDGKCLDMNATLDMNGVIDEDELLDEVSMDPSEWTQAIHLYYNDDLTEA